MDTGSLAGNESSNASSQLLLYLAALPLRVFRCHWLITYVVLGRPRRPAGAAGLGAPPKTTLLAAEEDPAPRGRGPPPVESSQSPPRRTLSPRGYLFLVGGADRESAGRVTAADLPEWAPAHQRGVMGTGGGLGFRLRIGHVSSPGVHCLISILCSFGGVRHGVYDSRDSERRPWSVRRAWVRLCCWNPCCCRPGPRPARSPSSNTPSIPPCFGFDHGDTHVNLIDTPGYPDFLGRTFFRAGGGRNGGRGG